MDIVIESSSAPVPSSRALSAAPLALYGSRNSHAEIDDSDIADCNSMFGLPRRRLREGRGSLLIQPKKYLLSWLESFTLAQVLAHLSRCCTLAGVDAPGGFSSDGCALWSAAIVMEYTEKSEERYELATGGMQSIM